MDRLSKKGLTTCVKDRLKIFLSLVSDRQIKTEFDLKAGRKIIMPLNSSNRLLTRLKQVTKQLGDLEVMLDGNKKTNRQIS